MNEKVVSLIQKRIDRSWDANIWWGIFSLAQWMAKRIRFLLDLVDYQHPELSDAETPGWKMRFAHRTLPIVRGRTIRRAMKALGRRWESLEKKIQNLRTEPEKFQIAIKIFVEIIMIKVDPEKLGSISSDERVGNILKTEPSNGHEVDAIIEILINFWFTRKEIFETIRWDTADKIRTISFDDVYNFLKSLRN